MNWSRPGMLRLVVSALFAVATLAVPTAAAADDGQEPRAYLDGRPIPLSEVGRYYCDDFDYPVIQCSRGSLGPGLRATLVSLLTSVDYVTVWSGATYSGNSMNMSQDYTSLVLIGWNDAISSFKGRNAETGRFTTDWFFNGTSYYFCCNSQVPSLGQWNNTFSSVERT